MSDGKKHVWHAQQEKILKEWSEISSSYRFMHDRAHGKFHTQNLWFALPVIVLSTVTGTANVLPTGSQLTLDTVKGFYKDAKKSRFKV